MSYRLLFARSFALKSGNIPRTIVSTAQSNVSTISTSTGLSINALIRFDCKASALNLPSTSPSSKSHEYAFTYSGHTTASMYPGGSGQKFFSLPKHLRSLCCRRVLTVPYDALTKIFTSKNGSNIDTEGP
ncbi:hypothetical protein VFPPC_03903 [Pochonia chlamydosporia 170]|uniref:Uncharacterized protein n=1 Tax=Pochonia chlamydosporia 170 TaxID=1380566 RepID=A0A179F2L7_METCM|nr:hypothetical protein VFPPC_03903 [Pochonia chlamydosporia 170]OAQ59692.2 hypothetical protein VFPPC_03903 [Pochonia chlamydosporia 170]